MGELRVEALAPFDINARDLGVLLLIDSSEPASQHQIAQRLGVDRTTIVAIIDALEAKGIIARHPDTEDRRRHVVGLTPAGQDILRQANRSQRRGRSRAALSTQPRRERAAAGSVGLSPRLL